MGYLKRFNHETSEPAIIAHDGRGADRLIMIDEISWAMCAENGDKRDLLLRLGKLLGYISWIDVRVNIILDNNKEIIIVKREYCNPCLYTGEVIRLSPNATQSISN